MGGRGTNSKVDARQLSLQWLIDKRKVERIVEQSEEIRNNLANSTKGNDKKTIHSYKQCACCEEYTIPLGFAYQVCPTCGWIDDDYQNMNPDSLDGKNEITLNDARRRY